jgi:hypothetical protein
MTIGNNIDAFIAYLTTELDAITLPHLVVACGVSLLCFVVVRLVWYILCLTVRGIKNFCDSQRIGIVEFFVGCILLLTVFIIIGIIALGVQSSNKTSSPPCDRPLKNGDIVQMKSGEGPKMTVNGYRDHLYCYEQDIPVLWIDATGSHEIMISPYFLNKVE